MELLRTEIAIVGAGAAGLWAAGRAARSGAGVLLLEKNRLCGSKILASGGERCNLTTTLDGAAAGRLFGGAGERFLRPALRALPPRELRRRFAELGVETEEHPLEKVFPRSGRARDVRDALEGEVAQAGAQILLEAAVQGLTPDGNGGWELEVAGDRRVRARKLLLCPGGASYPRTGTTGDGYAWLRELDLPLVQPVPALVPLRSEAAWVRNLAGVALQEVEARLVGPDRRVLGRRRRPVLFTHQGLSGPGAMDLSEPVARAEAAVGGGGVEGLAILLDLYPDRSWEELRALFIEAAGRRGQPSIGRALGKRSPRRVIDAAARQAGLPGSGAPAASLSKPSRHHLIEALKGLEVPIGGTLGFDVAEVTAGGLSLGAVNPRTMEVRGHPGLYVFGELLDLAGPIGGLNFQAAFATAELAARHASLG